MSSKPSLAQIERRFSTGKVELRAGATGQLDTIRGYAAKFNANSSDLGGFIEIIAPGAFDDVLTNDVRALFNHDANLILGRTKSGTCKIGIDEAGLWYEITPPDTTTARDLLVSLKRGDVDQSSFAFSCGEDDWKYIEGTMIRTILKVSALFDVSPVTYPAYPDTESCARTLDAAKQRLHLDPTIIHAQRARSLQLASAQL